MKNLNKFTLRISHPFRIYLLKTLIKRGRSIAAENFMSELICKLKITYKNYRPLVLLDSALLILRPLFILKKIKVGSVIYKVPGVAEGNKKMLFVIKTLLSVSSNNIKTVKIDKLVKIIWLLFTGQKNDAFNKKVLLYEEGITNLSFLRYLRRKPIRYKMI